MKRREKRIAIKQYPENPIQELKPLCRKLAAEGSVLLKNNGVLPFQSGQKIAVFGRTQETYIKSGTGSGGLVRPQENPCIITALRDNGVFSIDEDLAEIYRKWTVENPFDNGNGWATEPWSQIEMPLTDEIVKSASDKNDAAVVIIGRTAGEDRDNTETEGSFYLSNGEIDMISRVTAHFEKTVIVLNVGNLIDLSFIDKFPVGAVLYAWQGGGMGALALADVLSGKVSPCGKMPDTQALSLSDYPSYNNFGDRFSVDYQEDIYVGYRYFETFAPERVRYPFGFGKTYTDFEITFNSYENDGKIFVEAEVKNVGSFASREVVQIYYKSPCGHLGTPAKQLVAFKKTDLIEPNESQKIALSFDIDSMASYDDNKDSKTAFCYLLQRGDYVIYGGTDVRSASPLMTYHLESDRVVSRLEQIMPPQKSFSRLIAVGNEDGTRKAAYGEVTTSVFDLDERINERREDEIQIVGDKGIKLLDVANGNADLNDFIAQLSIKDLSNLVCGEGMNSPKVTDGTGGAFGGVTKRLANFGIPVCCVTDGPSGIRIGNDLKSTLLPNGYVFASSFDDELTERIFELESVELYNYNIDAILGPGMNIHRHPLCGRNFEYFSEDPLLSGKIAAAQTRGASASGCSTTLKHFCCNNQEFGRMDQNVNISERALREIYLKGFEIAVKEGKATSVMTSYNSINGYWGASNYDLTTTVLRNEWGFDGFVMSDWWAKCNCKGEKGTHENLKAMVRAHNDVYMVCESAESKVHNIEEGLLSGYITISDLQYCARNILRYILNSPTFEKFVDNGCKVPNWAID